MQLFVYFRLNWRLRKQEQLLLLLQRLQLTGMVVESSSSLIDPFFSLFAMKKVVLYFFGVDSYNHIIKRTKKLRLSSVMKLFCICDTKFALISNFFLIIHRLIHICFNMNEIRQISLATKILINFLQVIKMTSFYVLSYFLILKNVNFEENKFK